jgi:hypothetical protein
MERDGLEKCKIIALSPEGFFSGKRLLVGRNLVKERFWLLMQVGK